METCRILLLIVQKSQGQPPGMYKNPVNNGIKLPQLVSDHRISACHQQYDLGSFLEPLWLLPATGKAGWMEDVSLEKSTT